jgi:hypothetical protein
MICDSIEEANDLIRRLEARLDHSAAMTPEIMSIPHA